MTVDGTGEAPLRRSEREAAWILSGRANAVDFLPDAVVSTLRSALQRIATIVLSTRPAVQRERWLNDCGSYLPCAYPNHQVLRKNPTTQRDLDVFRWLEKSRPAFPQGSSPSPDLLFHAFAPDGQHFVPGEGVEEQRLAMRFQDELYARQHPADCSKVPILIMDYFHDAGGFGSWSHARAVALGLGVRAGRTVIELSGMQGYTQGETAHTALLFCRRA